MDGLLTGTSAEGAVIYGVRTSNPLTTNAQTCGNLSYMEGACHY